MKMFKSIVDLAVRIANMFLNRREKQEKLNDEKFNKTMAEAVDVSRQANKARIVSEKLNTDMKKLVDEVKEINKGLERK